MNVVSNPLISFKEIGAYQSQFINAQNPLWSAYDNRSNAMAESVPSLGHPLWNTRDASPVWQMMSGVQSRDHDIGSRYSPAQVHHRGFSSRLSGPWKPSNAIAQSQTQSLSKSLQSTQLTIQTKDGDTVTIQIREKNVQKSESEVSVSKSEEGSSQTAIVVQQETSKSSKSVDLSAVLSDVGVTDVNYQSEWKSSSENASNVVSNANGLTTTAAYKSKTYTVGSLEFQVDGSLDEEELNAIHDLLEGVDALSKSFFDGDVTQAFEQARQLGYDHSEIAGYSLELRNREYNVAEQKYRAASEIGQPVVPKGVFRNLGDYAYRLKTLEATDQVYFEGQVLKQLMDRVDENQRVDSASSSSLKGSKSSFSSFNYELLQQVNQLALKVVL